MSKLRYRHNKRNFIPYLYMDFPISAICVRNGKISGAWRHLIDAMKIFKDVGMTKQGRNWHVFVRGGEKLELLAKISTFVY